MKMKISSENNEGIENGIKSREEGENEEVKEMKRNDIRNEMKINNEEMMMV